jgi:hypothetical protein
MKILKTSALAAVAFATSLVSCGAEPISCNRSDAVARFTDVLNGPDFAMMRAIGGVTEKVRIDQIRTIATDFPPNGVSCVARMIAVRGPNGTTYHQIPYALQMLDDGSDFVVEYGR